MNRQGKTAIEIMSEIAEQRIDKVKKSTEMLDLLESTAKDLKDGFIMCDEDIYKASKLATQISVYLMEQRLDFLEKEQ